MTPEGWIRGRNNCVYALVGQQSDKVQNLVFISLTSIDQSNLTILSIIAPVMNKERVTEERCKVKLNLEVH